MRKKPETPTNILREIRSFHLVVGRFSVFIGIGEVRLPVSPERKKCFHIKVAGSGPAPKRRDDAHEAG